MDGTAQTRPGGVTRLGGRSVARIGYGAMQLEHADEAEAVTLLRAAADLGIDHVDTASFYGDATVNRLIRRAFAGATDRVAVVSKVGARRVAGTPPLVAAQKPEELRAQVELDLRTLGVERLAVVNLRRLDSAPGLLATGDQVVPIEDQLAELVALRDEGLVEAIGLSTVTSEQVVQSLPAGIVCVQNAYHLLDRSGERVLETCRAHDLAWVPYFPLGSAFDRQPAPYDDRVVRDVARQCDATPAQVCLAWLLAHDARTALIAGTRSVVHLEENVRAGALVLPDWAISALDEVGRGSQPEGAARAS